MPYVTSVERRATERGIQQGMQQGEEKVLERLLTRRFGPLSEATRQRLKNATLEQLERWTCLLYTSGYRGAPVHPPDEG